MTIGMFASFVFAALTIVVPITLTVMMSSNPHLLTPPRKFGISIALMVVAFVVPFFFPDLIAAFAPTNPIIVAVIYSLVVMPQGVVGAAIASALLARKLDGLASYNVNFAWWWTSLLGIIWSTIAFLGTGVAFANW